MIIIRHITARLDDPGKFREAWIEWCDAHPDQNLRIYNSIDGDQGVIVVEQLFADDDMEGPAFFMYGDGQARVNWWRDQPGFQAWWQKWETQGVRPIAFARRELWRLVD
jgi:hypothetical protein